MILFGLGFLPRNGFEWVGSQNQVWRFRNYNFSKFIVAPSLLNDF
jgi:hypothetical protein